MIDVTPGVRSSEQGPQVRSDDANVTRNAQMTAQRAPFNDASRGLGQDTTTPLRMKDAKETRLPIKTISIFTRQMSMLLRSGSSLVPAIRSIAKQMSNEQQKNLLSNIALDLEEGLTLTEAFRKHPSSFDAFFCAIVAAGEASATLPKMFDRLAGIVGKRRAMRKKIIGALAYPTLLIFMCIHIILGLMLFVMPRFAEMFIQLDVDVPASTATMLSIGQWVRAEWAILLASVLGIMAGIAWLILSEKGKQWLADIQLSIPIVGKLRSSIIQGGVFRTLGLLLESKVGLLDSIALIKGSTRNRSFQQLFLDLEESVTTGGSISYALESSGLVQPFLCQSVRTGEECGNLDGAMLFSADMLDETNTETIDVVTRLIEPIILIGMGVVVGAVALSLFVPLFDLTSAI